MLKLMLACCKVYISESRNRGALESIEKAAKLFPESPIVNKFEDEIYNRVGYTLVSKISPNSSSGSCSLPLKNASFAMVKAAFETIDLQEHCGTHPRLGVVDHICFHPLGTTSLDMVADTAKSLAFEVGSNLKGCVQVINEVGLRIMRCEGSNFRGGRNVISFHLYGLVDIVGGTCAGGS
ncbi:hypothetical protein KY290_032825 [Solanum tuberosum]|uniref:Formiminotransferase N-terminal subdomain domain-containing protein n=1 Tax=Solanum tuberosum TaxID=4113 RepID=A0ABQ7UD96_SOLTU|nr:hypothetical protein KY290_032825 [Solanum tuberosum]